MRDRRFVAAADGHEAFEKNLEAYRLDHGAGLIEHRGSIFNEKRPGLFMAAVWQAPPGAGAPAGPMFRFRSPTNCARNNVFSGS